MGCDDKQSVMHRQPPNLWNPSNNVHKMYHTHPSTRGNVLGVKHGPYPMILFTFLNMPPQIWTNFCTTTICVALKAHIVRKVCQLFEQNLGHVLLCGLWSMIRAVRSYWPFCPPWPRAHIRGQNSPNLAHSLVHCLRISCSPRSLSSTLFEDKLFTLTAL